jgi:sec-independent protein translocase protein TatA
MFNSIGLPELAIVLVIVLLIFGPKRLPGLGKALGGGMRDFKDAITGKDRGHDADDEPAPREQPAALKRASDAEPPAREAEPQAEPERVSEPQP